MKRFNGADIYQTRLYVKNSFEELIRAVLKRHECSEPGNKGPTFIEPIHTYSFKEL